MEHSLVYIALALLAYCLVSARLGAVGITMPMVCLALGLLIGSGSAVLDIDSATTFHHLAEVTLALLLFADATSLRRGELARISQRARRMLLVGLPVTILIGAALNRLLLPGWPLWEVCLLAALLAPTDAALGQSIRANPRIPQDFRDTLNAESGLNDGLALPFVIFFAGVSVGDSDPGLGSGALVGLVAREVGFGAAVGLLGGIAAGHLRNRALARGLMDKDLAQVAMLLLVGAIFFAAEALHGNAFVAVFAAGLAFANSADAETLRARHFLEGDGQFLAMLSFFFVGLLFLPTSLSHLSLAGVLVVALSLILVRPLGIWLSLIGTDTRPNERLFYGWFGPRGLATALFAVFVTMDFDGIARIREIVAIAMTAVLISAFVHGITAQRADRLFRLG